MTVIKIGCIYYAHATDVPGGGANTTGMLDVGESVVCSTELTSTITADVVAMGTAGRMSREGGDDFP